MLSDKCKEAIKNALASKVLGEELTEALEEVQAAAEAQEATNADFEARIAALEAA